MPTRHNPNRMHADVKTPPVSIRGFKHFLLTFHEESKCIDAHLMKNKCETNQCMKHCVDEHNIACHDAKKTLEVRTDGEGTFNNHITQACHEK